VRTFTTFDEVAEAAGTALGSTDWVEIDQQRVDLFAEATGDHQWIHVDVDRALGGPFEGTIAHGYLTLSMVPWLGGQVFALATPGAQLNYGMNKVRFPHPLRVGKRVRGHVSLGAVTDLPAGKQVVISYTVEIEGEPKPACVAETVVLLLADS
jgi:acyl dehydratase